MQNNYYFLKQLTDSLRSRILGFEAISCFSQNKNELILQLAKEGEVFNIRINTNSDISSVSFPASFARSKRNSVDLFKSIVGEFVSGVIQFENDRSFGLEFGSKTFVILLHGVRANVVLFEEEEPGEFFNKKLSHTFSKRKSELNRTINFSYQAFQAAGFDLKKLIFTFDQHVHAFLKSKGYEEKGHEEQWEMVEEVIEKLETPPFYLVEQGKKVFLSLVPLPELKGEFEDPIVAANAFYDFFHFTISFTRAKENLLAEVEKNISKTESFLQKTSGKLEMLKANNHFEQFANILMANLNNITHGAKSVSLFNFYDNSMVDIPLKEDLTPQKNAEVYYKKGKNKKFEIENLQSVIAGKEEYLAQLRKELIQIGNVKTIKELKSFTKQKDAQDDDKEQILPFKKIIIEGFEILIGKNARGNDEMISGYSHKEDLWLHAKDVTGSHVIVKYKSGKPFPTHIIERAAEIAAFNSKRKTDSHCPVIYTPRKWVRKQKGLPPGAVIVEKEKVILVTPKGY